MAVSGAWAAPPKPPKRPIVDQQAMREAMSAAQADEPTFGSAASYAHYLQARMAHHAGDHRRALDELRLALASDDGNPFLMTELAEELARLGDLDRAERELRRVIEQSPDYQPGQLLMGRVLYESDRHTRAKVHLQRAIKLRPRDTDAYLVLSQLWLDQGNADEAVRVVEELGAALPGEPMGYRRLGLALTERGDFERAERMLRKAADRDPGDFETWVALARVFDSTRRPEEADAAFGKALEVDPESQEVLLAAGRLALREGKVARARGYFDQLLSLAKDPELSVKVAFSYLATRQLGEAADVLDGARKAGFGEPRISFYSGIVHEKLNRWRKAAEAFSEVPRSAGELFHEARMHQASALSRAGSHKQALDLTRAGIEERPDYVPLYSTRARALERAGMLREAEGFLTRSLNERPEPAIFDALAALYQRQGRLADAITLLSRALAKRPRDETLLYTLGAAYERSGDVRRSLEKMRAVLDVNPENALALNFIGYTLADRGMDLEEAERMVNRALQLRPDSGAILDSLGWLYYRRGEFAKAVETLEKATELAPEEVVIIEHLGDAYTRVAKRDKAADAYRRALDALRQGSDANDAKSRRPALERKLKSLSSGSRDR